MRGLPSSDRVAKAFPSERDNEFESAFYKHLQQELNGECR